MSKQPGAGRPPHKPTEQTRMFVETLGGFGVTQEKLASLLKITMPTLRLHYREQLDLAATKVESHLVGRLMKLSNGSDGTALKAIIFMLQCKFGWSHYAPPPPEEFVREMPLGKKAQADLDAETAHTKSSWGDVLN